MRLGLPWRSVPKLAPRLAPEPLEQSSIALEYVSSRLEDAPRPGVLDLGAPIGSNLELYARHGARVTFADFHRFYEPTSGHPPSPARVAASVPASARRTDVIFAWDLFNHLSLEEIGWLGARVSETIAPGAVMLAYVANGGRIPASPANYAIVNRDTIRITPSGPSTEPAPDYSEQALLHSMHGLTVKSSFQLRTSMIEYLFTWE